VWHKAEKQLVRLRVAQEERLATPAERVVEDQQRQRAQRQESVVSGGVSHA